jgi:hypothetical protein
MLSQQLGPPLPGPDSSGQYFHLTWTEPARGLREKTLHHNIASTAREHHKVAAYKIIIGHKRSTIYRKNLMPISKWRRPL